jgi:pullulanase
VAVFFNVDKEARDITIAELRGQIFGVHKVQRSSDNDLLAKTATFNRTTGTFRIPPRTTVVFVSAALGPM